MPSGNYGAGAVQYTKPYSCPLTSLTSRDVRNGPNPEVATTRLLSSNWSSGRSYLCNGDAGDREQPTDNQLWGHPVAKEQHARNQGEHRKQQAEWCDAAHGATGNQPEPKAKPNNSSDENCVGEERLTATCSRVLVGFTIPAVELSARYPQGPEDLAPGVAAR